MTIGNIAPYRRKTLGRTDRFSTGSLVFDLHRPMNREPSRDTTPATRPETLDRAGPT